MLDDLTGDVLGLVLSYCPISDYKSMTLFSRSCYETHFRDPNSSAFTEWLLQIIAKSSEKTRNDGESMTREMWNEIEKFKPYVWKQLSRRKLIPKETTLDQISSLNCLQVIFFMNNNWLEMKNLFFSSDFYTFQASSRFSNLNGILSEDLNEDFHSVLVQNEGITIEAWINIPYEWNTVHGNDCVLVLRNKDSKHGIGLYISPKLDIRFGVGSKQTQCYLTKSYEWTHVAGVYDMKSNYATFYVNGEAFDKVFISDGDLDFEKNNMELVIAAASDIHSGTMKGEFTDIRVWNVARSGEQIRKSMGRRIFVYHFENTEDMNYLIFNYYPDPKMDAGNLILNKSPNFIYRAGQFTLQSHIDFLGGPIQSRLFHNSLKTAKFKI
ncbi:predicted protein [Naegleria gruberi]|uniref:Predicted protein n=1 Tax=Naegleria gruberi TaxID=5762 RepID=D2V0E5_NAEGR|nr:uncharacterized protein NAEGRDRAFT_62267 [Naegleria gruberi]EFC49704.1 predicted protein [Naegleria gruberi]|eukprot:XP_002682448.1 predicted protein [Naegleria gruberi strain NEG-M]